MRFDLDEGRRALSGEPRMEQRKRSENRADRLLHKRTLLSPNAFSPESSLTDEDDEEDEEEEDNVEAEDESIRKSSVESKSSTATTASSSASSAVSSSRPTTRAKVN